MLTTQEIINWTFSTKTKSKREEIRDSKAFKLYQDNVALKPKPAAERAKFCAIYNCPNVTDRHAASKFRYERY